MKSTPLHVLHIANSFGGTAVYSNLILALDRLGIRQTVFVPLNPKNRDRMGSQPIALSVPDSIIIYSIALKWYHRYLYNDKINIIKNEIEDKVDIESVNLMHAGLFCSDGAVAYELNKTYQIPYIVAVRNTDVNTYYKKMFWKRSYFHTILEKSKNIIFLSPQYKQTLLNVLKHKRIVNIDLKSIVIPNGVDSFYLENRVLVTKNINKPIRIVYAGAFNKGKNIYEVILGLDKLIQKGFKIHFSIIGRGLRFRKEDENYVNRIIELAENRDWVEIMDSKPKEELKKVFEKSDIFVMPSIPETFGLVYVEALSQGLPIIYAKGQGFDGYYSDKNIGYGVNPSDINDIADKIEFIIKNFDQVSLNISQLNLKEDFSWEKISEHYLKLYKKILSI
jgi:glycosyltransferase involved in cell wall biosynthesis